MSDEKFTPGPWVAEIHRINTPNEHSVGFFVRTITDIPGERRQITGYVKTYNSELFNEIEADAALIAAAPEMYNAIMKIVRSECPNCRLKEDRCDCRFQELADVLKKARGEE